MAGRNTALTISFDQLGGITGVPPEFIAAMDLHEEVTPGVGVDVMPDPLSDTVFFSRIDTDRINERQKHTYFKKPGNITLLDFNTDDNGQPVQVTRTLYPATSAAAPPTATVRVGVKDLGNGWKIQEASVTGTYVNGVFTPSVFQNPLYKVEIPDSIPLKFRAIVPIDTVANTVAGTAQMPIPGVGDLIVQQEQVDEFKVRVTRTYRNLGSLPISIVGYDTSDPKQVVTVTETLQLATADRATPSSTRTVVVENLGDGTVLQTTRDVPDVFSAISKSVAVPDVVPPEFRVQLPSSTTTSRITGNASTPTLTGPDLSATERQLDEYIKEIARTTSGTLPPGTTLTLDGLQLENGNLVKIKKTLANGSQTFTPGSLFQEGSTSIDLGNGQSLMTLRKVDGYPLLLGQRYDAQRNVIEPFTEQIVARDEAEQMVGTPYLDVTPENGLVAIVRNNAPTEVYLEGLDAYFKMNAITIPRLFGIPKVLWSVNLEWAISPGIGAGDEDGLTISSGNSAHIDLNCTNSSQATSSIVPTAVPRLQEFDLTERPGLEICCYVEDNLTHEQVLAKIIEKAATAQVTIPGMTSAGIKLWPFFQPVESVITCKSETATVRATATARLSVTRVVSGSASDGGASGSTEDTIGYSRGKSYDQHMGVAVQTVVIPPCIHGDITVGETSNGGMPGISVQAPPAGTALLSNPDADSTWSQTVPVTASAKAGITGAFQGIGASSTVTLKAKGSVSPAIIRRVPGLTAIPNDGLYAQNVTVELFQKGRSFARVILFDFAVLRSDDGAPLGLITDEATGGSPPTTD